MTIGLERTLCVLFWRCTTFGIHGVLKKQEVNLENCHDFYDYNKRLMA
jgi:hypothetical protein